MLLRLDAARARLGAHHSAPGRGMRRGGGGGGGIGGGGDVQAAKKLLLSLLDGAFPGGGQRFGGGNGGGRRGGGQGPGSRPREGEWPCPCGFATNRPHRVACFACGRARGGAEFAGAAGGKGYGGGRMAEGKGQKERRSFAASGGGLAGKGPVGAGGTRPLLGGRGRSPLQGAAGGAQVKGKAPAPIWDGQGPPLSASLGKGGAFSKAGDGRTGKGDGKGDFGGCNASTTTYGRDGIGRPWARPAPVVDDEGFQLVQRRRARNSTGDSNEDGPKHDHIGGGGDGSGVAAARRRWSDVDDGADDGDAFDEEVQEEDCDVADDGAGEEWEADPRQLRDTFEEHARAVRQMERSGCYGAALTTLRSARDEAERKWREAKPPAPLPKRLDWADTKLRKAQAALTRVRLELDAFDEETDRKRADICRRIEQAQAWYSWRKEKLDALHDEAAETAPGRRAAATDCGSTCEARRKIRGRVLPEMQAILEECQEGTALHGRIALAVADLADAEARLGAPREEGGPARYNMDDDDSQGDGWEHERDNETDDDDCMHDEETSGARQVGRPAGWRPEGPSRWTRADATKGNFSRSLPREGEGQTTGSADQGNVGHGIGKGRPAETTSGNTSCPMGEAVARGPGGAAAAGTDADGGERAGKHRRRQTAEEKLEEERGASDARRAQELQKQLEHATAAQEWSFSQGKGGFGSEAALSTAAQGYVLEVQRTQARASEMGVEARSKDGRALLELSPAELRIWVQENLDGDNPRE